MPPTTLTALQGPDASHPDTLPRPPPLTIPQPLSHHQYSNIPSHNSSSAHGVSSNGSSLFNLHAPAFHQLPNTPSGSSSTSSPPFSASVLAPRERPCILTMSSPHQQPAQMNHSSHSPANSRPGSLSQTTLANSYHSNHYGSVKVEDDHYSVRVPLSYPSLPDPALLSLPTTTTTTTDSQITTTRPFLRLHTPCPKPVTWTIGMRIPIRLSEVARCTGRTLPPIRSFSSILCRIYPFIAVIASDPLLSHHRFIHILLILIFWTVQLYSGNLVDMCMHV